MVTTPYYYGRGRRKRTSVRLRLASGKGLYLLNGSEQPLPDYLQEVLHLTHLEVGSLDISARATGGGITGWRDSLRMALARAILVKQADLRPVLKAAGLLTRDSREKERKKPGLKRARRAPQFSKR